MIISRTPFRISFLGGGTDLPVFYEQEEGLVVSTTINKFVYITVNDRFDETYRLSYSKTEICDRIDQIEHPILRAVLQRHAPEQKGLEVISMADIPSGTGLGSSSSFTVGTLHALLAHVGKFQSAEALAEEACRIELEDLREPIGKQDQYAAAIGGLQTIRFSGNGQTVADPVICSDACYQELQASVVLFFTGFARSASAILAEQKKQVKVNMNLLREMKGLAKLFCDELRGPGRIQELGRLLGEGWQLKRNFASGVSSSDIDSWYEKGIKAGAYGGKILGAGGGGFLMFLCAPERKDRLISAMKGLRPFPVQFERSGSRIIFVS